MRKEEYDPIPETLEEAMKYCGGPTYIRRILKSAGVKITSGVIKGWRNSGHIPAHWEEIIAAVNTMPVLKPSGFKYLLNFIGGPRVKPPRRPRESYPNPKLHDLIYRAGGPTKLQRFLANQTLQGKKLEFSMPAIYGWLEQGFIPAYLHGGFKRSFQATPEELGVDPETLPREHRHDEVDLIGDAE